MSIRVKRLLSGANPALDNAATSYIKPIRSFNEKIEFSLAASVAIFDRRSGVYNTRSGVSLRTNDSSVVKRRTSADGPGIEFESAARINGEAFLPFLKDGCLVDVDLTILANGQNLERNGPIRYLE